MIHLPWILFLIGNIGYQLYKEQVKFFDDDRVMLLSVFIAFFGFIASGCIYGSMLIDLILYKL